VAGRATAVGIVGPLVVFVASRSRSAIARVPGIERPT
jgi:hypothetical protein